MATSNSDITANIRVRYYYCTIGEIESNLLINSAFPKKASIKIGDLESDTLNYSMLYDILNIGMNWVDGKISHLVNVELPLIPTTDQPTIPIDVKNAFCHYACFLIKLRVHAQTSRTDKMNASIELFKDMAEEAIENFTKNIHRYTYSGRAISSPIFSSKTTKHFSTTGMENVQSGISTEGNQDHVPYQVTGFEPMVDRIEEGNI